MKEEYDYIRCFLENNQDLKQKFLGIYWAKKFDNYIFNLNRIDISYKDMWIKLFREEFKLALENNEIDMALFDKRKMYFLKLLINKPHRFYEKLHDRLNFVQKIFSVKNDKIYSQKVITVFGLKLRIASKKLAAYKQIQAVK